MPVGKPRRRPRPRAADRRDLSGDTHPQGWAEKGARRFGRGRRNSLLKPVNLGRGGAWGERGDSSASLVSSPHDWSPLASPPWVPPPSLAPSPGAACAAPYPGLALRVLGALTWEHGRPRPRPAGNFPDLLASIATVAAAGWLCVCARVRVCVRLCVRPAGRRAGSSEPLRLSPARHAAAARSSQRLTGGCVAPTRSEPPSPDPRVPHPPREAGAHAAGACGAGAGAEPMRLGAGPALGCGAVVLNGQLHAPLSPGAAATRDWEDAVARAASLLSFASLRAPLRPELSEGPTPFPTPRILR